MPVLKLVDDRGIFEVAWEGRHPAGIGDWLFAISHATQQMGTAKRQGTNGTVNDHRSWDYGSYRVKHVYTVKGICIGLYFSDSSHTCNFPC
jgi:hypothetical protein